MVSLLCLNPGCGLQNQFPPFRSVPDFSSFLIYVLTIEYHVNTGQVSPQLPAVGDTSQIWMWSKLLNWHFCKIDNFPKGEIKEYNFSKPQSQVYSVCL